MTEAARHLVKIEVFFDGQNAYSFNYEGKVHVFRGDAGQLAKFLQSFRAKDNKTQPRSVRGERYADIAKEITDQTDNIIYAWSNDLANALNKRKESVERVNESDELYLNGRAFKSLGLYDKTAKVYGRAWADILLKFADDAEARKAGYYLMAYDDLRSMWVTDSRGFGQDMLFFCDKSGEREGDFIKFGLIGGVFSNAFARSHAPTFMGMEDGELVVKCNDMCLHTFESVDTRLNVTEAAFDSVFLFYDSEVQELFRYWLDRYHIKYSQAIYKIWTSSNEVIKHNEITALIDKHPEEVQAYKISDYELLKRQGVLEAVKLTGDGAEIDNSDGMLLDHLFGQLEGDPRWKVDKGHRRCIRNDGCYFCIKGNMLETGKNNREPLITIPWTKEISFTLLPDAEILVRFEVNAAGPGRFRI